MLARAPESDKRFWVGTPRCGFFVTAAIAGIVCGHIALSRIKANPELEGHGLAMAGLIIGYVAVAGWLTWILLFGGLAVLEGISESMTKH